METKDIPKHDCLDNSKVVSCDGETDECECRICGRKWTESCSFDDDYN
jgi:hypothetical protein